MVVVVLLLAVAVTAYVGWLMWNAPASPPRRPGTGPLHRGVAWLEQTRVRRHRRRARAVAMRQWEHRSTT